MEAVAMPSFAEFNPNLPAIKKLLPEVNRIAIEFYQANPLDPFDASLHRASEVIFDFDNGTQLNVPGYMLWKFIQMIPDELSDGNRDYRAENPYTSDSPEALMDRIRLAYACMFTEAHYPYKLPPVRATLLPHDDKLDVSHLPSLTPETLTWLKTQVSTAAEARKAEAISKISPLVASAIQRPHVIMRYVNVGPGISPRYFEEEWQNLDSMTMQDFLHEFSPNEHESCPAHKHFSDEFMEMIGEETDNILADIFGKYEGSRTVELRSLTASLQLDESSSIGNGVVLQALKSSQNYGEVINLVTNTWWNWIIRLPVSEIANMASSAPGDKQAGK